MGRKSKIKAIKRLAANLPAMTMQAMVTTKLTGSELIETGVKEVNGEPVQYGKSYLRKAIKTVPVDHVKHMKKMYDKHKAQGIMGYVSAIRERDAKLTADANHS
jgi:hypothetical protein